MVAVYHLKSRKQGKRHVAFDRHELGQIMSIYSKGVSRGEWRDYAIDLLDDLAVFSIFRHTHEHPLFTVVKSRGHKNRHPEYGVYSGPKCLKKSRSLSEALGAFEQAMSPA